MNQKSLNNNFKCIIKIQQTKISYMHKFSRDVIFLRTIEIQDFCSFIFKDNLLPTLELHVHCDYFKKIRGLLWMTNYPAKEAKITSLENFYAYGTCVN